MQPFSESFTLGNGLEVKDGSLKKHLNHFNVQKPNASSLTKGEFINSPGGNKSFFKSVFVGTGSQMFHYLMLLSFMRETLTGMIFHYQVPDWNISCMFTSTWRLQFGHINRASHIFHIWEVYHQRKLEF